MTGGIPVGPIAGGGAHTVYRMVLADGLRVHDQPAAASESGIYVTRCMLCDVRTRDFADPVLGSEATAAAQLRDRAHLRELRATCSSVDESPADRRAAAKSLHQLGAHPERHWCERLTYDNAAGERVLLWDGCNDAPRGTFRDSLHQELLGLVENAWRYTLEAVKRDGRARGLGRLARKRIPQVLDLRARAAGLAFDDGATEPVTAVTGLSVSTKYTGDRRFDALFALSVALSSDAFLIGDARVLRRLQRAINALIATIEMERPLQFSQPQLDAYLASAVTAADAFVAAFKTLMPSACNTIKVHAAHCHRELECREGGAPSMRSAQHFEKTNSAMVASYKGSNKQSLAGLAVRTTDLMAAQVITDVLGLHDGTNHSRPLGAATSLQPYPPLEPGRTFSIAATALVRVPDSELPGGEGGGYDDDDEPPTSALGAICQWAAAQQPEGHFDPRAADIHAAHTASVEIPGRLRRPRLDARTDVYAVLGRDAAGVDELSLRSLRVARVVRFYQLRIIGEVKTLAVATDLVTCTVSSPLAADRAQARFCRDYAFTMVPVRTARARDYDDGRACRFRVLDFADPGDVLRLGHVLRRAMFEQGVARSATSCRGDYFLCIAKLLPGATRQPSDEGLADWLPTD